MPRTVDPTLRMMYERMNPNVCEFVEISQPDVGQVLRRWVDQFSVNPPRVSETPSNTTQASPGGGMMLKATPSQVASFYTDALIRIPLDVPDQSKIIRGVGWQLDSALKPLRLKRVTVKISVTTPTITNLELQIYRMRGVPGRVINNDTGQIIAQKIEYTPTPLLPQPARIASSSVAFIPNTTVDVVFDLTAFQLDIEHRNVPAPSLFQTGETPELIFEVWVTDPKSKGNYRWEEDNTTARVIAGLGTFRDMTWTKRMPDGSAPLDVNDPLAFWNPEPQPGQVPCIKLDIDTYPATSQEVYAITLPRVPNASSTGRIRFIREVPLDASATLELSTAGSGGPFVAVAHGDVVSTKQTSYHLRATLNASADTHRSPVIEELGIEFRTPVDVSAEATVAPIPQDMSVPYLEAAIGEGRATVIRTGRRDYHDPASDILTQSAATQLELDHYLGSRHPAITRDKWLQLGRYIVTSREPTPTSEIFSLISYLKVAKKKIPQRSETVNAILTVITGTTTSAIKVTGPLPGTSIGDEYDGQGYYIRIVSTAVAGLAPGMIALVAGNTSTNQIDLSEALPAALAIGDTFELHSATYQQPKLSWVNADPADVWWEIFTVRLGVPSERIGLAAFGRAGRAGLPPKLADRAPGDAATQDKLRVSREITDENEGLALIAQLSFLMQGVTTEIGGQIVFRQIFDLLDPAGNVVLPAEEIAATFDARDYSQLGTPQGVESRVTVMACDYGVDSSLGSDAPAPSTVTYADADAVAWFTQQDLDEIGNGKVPDDIAKWCFNSVDSGLYLSSIAARQVVRIASTGLRQWPFVAVDMHPDLVVGDRVVVMTDQYTDFDPTRKIPMRGLWAFPLVLTKASPNGREFRGLMLGLWSAVPVLGGSGTPSVGSVGQPSLSTQFDAAGNLLVTLNQGSPPGGGFRVAASTAGMPSDATVDAATFVPGSSATVNLGAGWGAGATIQIRAFAYASSDTAGARSPASTAQAKVAGGGAGNTFTSVSHAGVNYTTNIVTMAWVWGGAAATFNVWVSELGSAFFLDGSGLAGSPHAYASSEDLRASGGNTTDHIIFYVEAIIGGVVVATSAHSDIGYRAQV